MLETNVIYFLILKGTEQILGIMFFKNKNCWCNIENGFFGFIEPLVLETSPKKII